MRGLKGVIGREPPIILFYFREADSQYVCNLIMNKITQILINIILTKPYWSRFRFKNFDLKPIGVIGNLSYWGIFSRVTQPTAFLDVIFFGLNYNPFPLGRLKEDYSLILYVIYMFYITSYYIFRFEQYHSSNAGKFSWFLLYVVLHTEINIW